MTEIRTDFKIAAESRQRINRSVEQIRARIWWLAAIVVGMYLAAGGYIIDWLSDHLLIAIEVPPPPTPPEPSFDELRVLLGKDY